MKAIIQIELEFEDWHDDGLSPKTKQDWAEFFVENLITDGSVIGTDGEDGQRQILLHSLGAEVKKITEE